VQRTEFFHLGGTLVAESTRPLVGEIPSGSHLHCEHRGTPRVKISKRRQLPQPPDALRRPYDGIWGEGPGFTMHATDEVAQLSHASVVWRTVPIGVPVCLAND
jgi:hypothetical protein